MCLMCQEEDLYFLYLEQHEQAQKRARGETAAANANWLWPSFVTAQTPASEVLEPPAKPTTARSRAASKPDFTCDAAE